MFFFNGAQAQVTISGSIAVGVAQRTSSQQYKYISTRITTTTNYQDLYTVTNGKRFMICSIFISAVGDTHILGDNGTEVFRGYCPASGYVQVAHTLTNPIPIVTKLQIKGNSGGSNVEVFINGYEVDASLDFD